MHLNQLLISFFLSCVVIEFWVMGNFGIWTCEGINRGVFGVTSAKRREIEDLVMQLESQNPTPNPTFNLEKVE